MAAVSMVFCAEAFARRLAQEVAHEIADVLGTLAQRRNAQRHDVEAIEEIFAEKALLDLRAQIAVRGGDDAHVGLDGRAPADGRILALLQHAQKTRLCLERHVADLVEEQRAAFGLLEAALRSRLSAGEGALLVAEQFALDQLARNSGHIDGDHRALAALAEVMQHARDKLLAGAALALDHDGEIRLREPGERAIDLLHGRRAADEWQLLAFHLGDGCARASSLACKRAADDRHDLRKIEGLRQIFVSPLLRCRKRRHQACSGRS